MPTSTSSTNRHPPSWRTLLVVAVCVLHALPSMTRVSCSPASPRGRFKAAVYEHAVILPESRTEIVTREKALNLMRRNLDVYSAQAAEAKKQGADILVFPEDGLYGFGFTWDSLTPYLEYIPDPNVVHWVPCDDPSRFPNTEVQQALSCLAKKHSLYLVANMGDYQPCHHHVLPNCNHIVHNNGEEHLQYNTDVAFDPSGKLVARYHKQHLFFEKQFDTPVTPDLTTFDTPFGRWGLFTCFDILFHDPAVTLVKDLAIANIAFPTAWMDAQPLLASVGFHSAFARGMGVNFLAANIHLPLARFQGSGIYTPKGMAAFVHNTSLSSQPRLIVTEIDILDKPEPEGLATGNRKSAESVAMSDGMGEKTDVQVMGSSSNATDPPYSEMEGERSGASSRSETAFVSELFHDLFNFVQLEEPSSTLHVCQQNVCCHLTYSISPNPQSPELFALGAFDGLHTYEGSYYLQICALVRCANLSRQSCGSPTSQSATTFHSLSLRGDMQTQFVYPEVLLTTENDQLRLAEAGEWSFEGGVVRSEEGFSYPLLAASLFGRWYDRDYEVMGSASPDSEDVRDGGVAGISVERLLMAMCVAVAHWWGYVIM